MISNLLNNRKYLSKDIDICQSNINQIYYVLTIYTN